MIDQLINILPPPAQRSLDSVALAAFESNWGMQLPSDFKGLVSVYGSGSIDGFIWLLDPLAKNSNLNFEKSRYFVEAYVFLQQEFSSDYPRPEYPAKGSFFPWAVTDNGETFVWLVDGEPESWKIAIHSSDQGEEEIYNFGCVEFILKLLRGELLSRILPGQFPDVNLDVHVFTAVE
ncbi:SMI1/KNR4 family protein [Pseudomonas sp. 5P_5.1_Bac1]|uniref:SMI1/KNR4 family protein n=1 Tax=Pseudomonas sp. 5P_5.1_Bac1 TaxID=2971616 RepID=UPI0021C5D4C3|nr:SMI1/KNR4 family protein [Pseudomonas sp. 5P_5.1_Bac1]MCU1720756.1 SMI1/KNR4 family protein [Pseudomonas sp. 5P_5.1_Bac1]